MEICTGTVTIGMAMALRESHSNVKTPTGVPPQAIDWRMIQMQTLLPQGVIETPGVHETRKTFMVGTRVISTRPTETTTPTWTEKEILTTGQTAPKSTLATLPLIPTGMTNRTLLTLSHPHTTHAEFLTRIPMPPTNLHGHLRSPTSMTGLVY